MPHVWFSYLVCGVLTPGQLLPCLKEGVADLYQNICCSVLLCNVTKSSKAVVADSTWVQSTVVTIHSMCVVYSNNTQVRGEKSV